MLCAQGVPLKLTMRRPHNASRAAEHTTKAGRSSLCPRHTRLDARRIGTAVCIVDVIQRGFIYLKSKQPGKEVGPQITDDNIESNASSQHQPNHAAKTRKYTQVRRLEQEPWNAAPAPGQACQQPRSQQICTLRSPREGKRLC